MFPSSTSSGGSRLTRMQAQFQQKQREDKEAKLLQMLDSQQQRAIQKASLNGNLPSKYNNTNNNNNTATRNSPNLNSINNNNNNNTSKDPNMNLGNGKVRQMFEERRKGGGGPFNGVESSRTTPAPTALSRMNSNPSPMRNVNGNMRVSAPGIDKSYPLNPLSVSKSSKTRTTSSKSDPTNGPSPSPAPPVQNHHPQIKSVSNTPLKKPLLSSTLNSNRDSNSSSKKRPAGGLESNFNSRDRPSPDSNALGLNSNTTTTTKYVEMYGNSRGQSPSPAGGTAGSRRDREGSSGGINERMRRLNLSPDERGGGGGGLSQSSNSNFNSKPKISSVKVKVKSPMKFRSPIGGSRPSSKTSVSKMERSGPPPGSEECKICGRYFASDRIEKHSTICKKTANNQKKRKVYDPIKMRMQGTEAEPYIRTVITQSAKTKKSPIGVSVTSASSTNATKKVNWRKQHEDFINTIRAAKEYQAHVARGGNPADMPPPPPADYTDYVQCPHCGRKFNEGVAGRHIPKCKNIKSNKR